MFKIRITILFKKIKKLDKKEQRNLQKFWSVLLIQATKFKTFAKANFLKEELF